MVTFLRFYLYKSKVIFSILGAVLFFGITSENAAVIIVDPTDNQGWFIKNASTGTGGLSTNQPDNHGSNGSFELIIDGSNGQIIQIARVPIPLITVKNLTTVGWEIFSVAGEVPLAKIEYWSPGKSGTLVYDGSNESNGAGWQTADGFTGLWWSTEFGQADKRTLATWQATDIGDTPSNFFRLVLEVLAVWFRQRWLYTFSRCKCCRIDIV